MQENQDSEQREVTQPIYHQSTANISAKESVNDDIFRKINRATALVLVITAIAFALVSLLAIWEVFGSNTGDVVWRSLSSMGTIALTALVVNVAAKLVEQNKKT